MELRDLSAALLIERRSVTVTYPSDLQDAEKRFLDMILLPWVQHADGGYTVVFEEGFQIAFHRVYLRQCGRGGECGQVRIFPPAHAPRRRKKNGPGRTGEART